MTARTLCPVSNDSLLEALSLFWGNQDEKPNPLLAEYEQLGTSGLNEGAVEENDQTCTVEQLTGSAVDISAETTATEDQDKKTTT